MKRKTNLILTGLSLVLFASCSEDAQLPEMAEKQAAVAKSVTGKESTALTVAENSATILCGKLSEGATGWADGDSIWTYTLQSLGHNSYVLNSGVGSTVATFSRTSGTDEYQDGGTVYAVSSAKYVYGLAATFDGGAQLTVTIPNRYKAEDVGAQEGQSRMPVPFWGTATFGDDGNLETEMSGLTALLKVDTSTLPAGTRALVLTTHLYTDLIGAETALDEGDDQPLCGTFDAILEPGAQLAPNPIFYSYDTLRVNLAETQAYQHLYIPVVASTYSALHVIAVTGDSRYAYEWQGRVLKTFGQDTPFSPNTIVALEPETTAIHTPRM